MTVDKRPSIIRKVSAYRRKSRVNSMLSKVAVTTNMKVVNIGCGVDGSSFDDYVPEDWQITGIDIQARERVLHRHPRFSYIQQEAQDLSRFKTCEFDLAVSIGVLEHITEEPVFKCIVSEIRRVARQYIVVVPYKYCWLEPHYNVPFFPLFPYSMKLNVVKALNLRSQRKVVTRDPEYINKNYRWLSNAQYRAIFPDSIIHFLPMFETIAITKSLKE